MRWLHLRLRAPLMSFGGVAIDAYGVIYDFPAQSMLVGLLANALGWTRSMRANHQELQDRLVFGAVHEHVSTRLRDYQTAKLYQDDAAWSTRGAPIGRRRSSSYNRSDERGQWLTAQRWRDYEVDMSVSVVVRLYPVEVEPTLDDMAAALLRPARPLFIGRKNCLPSAPLLVGDVEAPDACAALRAVAPSAAADLPGVWPAAEGKAGLHPATDVTDERNWISGLHGGARRVRKGRLSDAEDAWTRT